MVVLKSQMVVLALAILAVWRVCSLLVDEDGPWNVSKKMRAWLWDHVRILGELFSCIWCVSLWISAVVVIYLFYIGHLEIRDLPLWWLAVSGGSIALHSFVTRMYAGWR